MNRKGIEVSTLRIFKTVAELGSVTAAAEKLCYVQSNVTSRIQRLEQTLDAPLFHRQKRRMTLTHAGENLLSYADRILRLVDEACVAVAETSGEGGILRIGSLESTAATRLPPMLTELRRLHPKIQLTVSTGPTDPLVRDLLDYRLDCAFVSGKVGHPEIICEPVFTEELVLITECSHKAITTQIETVLLVFRQGCSYRTKAETLFREMGWAPMRIMELGTLDGILGCVAAGIGVAVLPRSVINQPHYKDILQFTRIPPNLGRVQTMLIRRRDAVTLPCLKWFLEIVVNEAKKKPRRL